MLSISEVNPNPPHAPLRRIVTTEYDRTAGLSWQSVPLFIVSSPIETSVVLPPLTDLTQAMTGFSGNNNNQWISPTSTKSSTAMSPLEPRHPREINTASGYRPLSQSSTQQDPGLASGDFVAASISTQVSSQSAFGIQGSSRNVTLPAAHFPQQSTFPSSSIESSSQYEHSGHLPPPPTHRGSFTWQNSSESHYRQDASDSHYAKDSSPLAESPPSTQAPTNSTTSVSENNGEPKLACPYYQRQPTHPRLQRSCCGPGFPSIPRLKEHLYRRHRSYTCSRCNRQFYQEKDFKVHNADGRTCPTVGFPIDKQNGFGDKEEKFLRTKRRRMQWQDIYKELFPNEEVPSQHYSNDSRRHLDDYRTRLRTAMQTRLPDLLQRTYRNYDAQILQNLCQTLPNLMCTLIDQCDNPEPANTDQLTVSPHVGTHNMGVFHPSAPQEEHVGRQPIHYTPSNTAQSTYSDAPSQTTQYPQGSYPSSQYGELSHTLQHTPIHHTPIEHSHGQHRNSQQHHQPQAMLQRAGYQGSTGIPSQDTMNLQDVAQASLASSQSQASSGAPPDSVSTFPPEPMWTNTRMQDANFNISAPVFPNSGPFQISPNTSFPPTGDWEMSNSGTSDHRG